MIPMSRSDNAAMTRFGRGQQNPGGSAPSSLCTEENCVHAKEKSDMSEQMLKYLRTHRTPIRQKE